MKVRAALAFTAVALVIAFTYVWRNHAAKAALPPYKPIPCIKLIHKGHLENRRIGPDTLGILMAAALREHGLKDGPVTSVALGRAVADFLGCFTVSPK